MEAFSHKLEIFLISLSIYHTNLIEKKMQ